MDSALISFVYGKYQLGMFFFERANKNEKEYLDKCLLAATIGKTFAGVQLLSHIYL